MMMLPPLPPVKMPPLPGFPPVGLALLPVLPPPIMPPPGDQVQWVQRQNPSAHSGTPALMQRNPFRQMPITLPPPPMRPSLPGLMPAAATATARATNAAPAVAGPNRLKHLFQKNEAVIFALNIRTFGAEDRNGDGRISSHLQENGTFRSAIKQLDELQALGVNTIHLLPINPIGATKRLGEAGSLYAPSDYHTINPEFGTVEDARAFVDACHQRGIQVMVDVPSCASLDLAQKRPDLILKDAHGRTLTPTNWVDIVMFKNGPALQEYFEGFFDLMVNQVGVDGFRVDVARARPPEFWQHFTQKYPDKAWMAESYTEEDQSPLKNLPRDIPEQLMKSGFDSYYGQWHIFHGMRNAREYQDYLLSNRAMFQRVSTQGGQDKSFIGSFVTHDDPSLMERGGVAMCLLASGLMTTQPWTNPYILDGFTTGYTHEFDIFNFVPRHRGQNPEIGQFLKQMLTVRRQYGPVLTQGTYIPLPVQSRGGAGDNADQIIAFARQAQGKTLLVVANKDVNARARGQLTIPGLSAGQRLQNLAPEYGRASQFQLTQNQMQIDLGPGRFHVFEIDTPHLGASLPAY